MDAGKRGAEDFWRDLTAVVRGFVRELHPQRARLIDIALSSRIERDLGIDSLGRTELVLRIERAFHVRLQPTTIGEAETVEDLVRALEQAAPALERVSLVPPTDRTFPAEPARDARTLIEALEWHVAQHPDRLHLTVLQDEATVLASRTYRELATRARRIALDLIHRDVSPGDRVGLMLPTSIESFVALFGVLYAGAIPVPSTRTVLRGDQWFPRRSPISVEFGDPIRPTGSDFQAIIQLRDRVRQPDLEELVKPKLT